MRSGDIYLPNATGTFRGAGEWGYDWSSRASSMRYDGADIPSAYFIDFGPSVVRPSYGPYIRYNAFPLRCLSTVLGMGEICVIMELCLGGQGQKRRMRRALMV